MRHDCSPSRSQPSARRPGKLATGMHLVPRAVRLGSQRRRSARVSARGARFLAWHDRKEFDLIKDVLQTGSTSLIKANSLRSLGERGGAARPLRASPGSADGRIAQPAW